MVATFVLHHQGATFAAVLSFVLVDPVPQCSILCHEAICVSMVELFAFGTDLTATCLTDSFYFRLTVYLYDLITVLILAPE